MNEHLFDKSLGTPKSGERGRVVAIIHGTSTCSKLEFFILLYYASSIKKKVAPFGIKKNLIVLIHS